MTEALDIAAAESRMHAASAEYDRALRMAQPSMMLRPRLFIDGNMWCALYGDNLQDGVAGFGESPELAYEDFDKTWKAKLPAPAGEVAGG